MSLVLLATREATPKLLTCSFEANIILVNKAFLTLTPNLAAILAIKKLAIITEVEFMMVKLSYLHLYPLFYLHRFVKHLHLLF